MQSVIRVEIIADTHELPQLLKAIRASGADGYTLLRHVAGAGHRGRRDDDGPTDVGSNVMLIVAAPPDVAERLADKVRPILARLGGICLLSEAKSVRH